ncbi:hypothetical protein EZS27_044272, partial [termite gut metagenome]
NPNSKFYLKDGLWKEHWPGYHFLEETQEIMKKIRILVKP